MRKKADWRGEIEWICLQKTLCCEAHSIAPQSRTLGGMDPSSQTWIADP